MSSPPWLFRDLDLDEGTPPPKSESEIEQDMKNQAESMKVFMEGFKAKLELRAQPQKLQKEPKVFKPGEDYSVDNYGVLQLDEILGPRYTTRGLHDIDERLVGKEIYLRGRLQISRKNGEQCLIVLRSEGKTIQVIVSVNDVVSPEMIEFISNISEESIIDVLGTVVKLDEPVEGCTQKLYEVHATEVWVVSAAAFPLPLDVKEEDKKEVDQKMRLDHRVLDLRAPANKSIFKLQAVICQLFRDALYSKGFLEIHTPKIMKASTESGTTAFPVSYFKDVAYLAESPQFHKQLAIASDFQKVFTIGSVFRAEDSNTPLHLTEFVGLDLEMELYGSYRTLIDMIVEIFNSIFDTLNTQHKKEIDTIAQHYPVKCFHHRSQVLVLEYTKVLDMLWYEGIELGDEGPLTVANEKLLGRLVETQFGTDFFVLDKYPIAHRPFYTMPDPKDQTFSNSFDMFMRGVEVLTGSQRIHDWKFLQERAIKENIDLKQIKHYIDGFKYGCPPHAGVGIGLERFLMLYLGLDDIRSASLFPRDPVRLTP